MILPLLLALVAPASQPADGFTINLIPPTVQRVMFDPQHPRDEIPKLADDESAITQFRFDVRVTAHTEIETQSRQPDGRWQVTAKLRVDRIDLAMENVLYLPFDAKVPLRSHEEGHREINERVYEKFAESEARRVARENADKSWTGEGATVESASDAATSAAVKELTTEFQKSMAEKSKPLADAFDRMTNHGRSDSPASEAVNAVFRDEKS